MSQINRHSELMNYFLFFSLCFFFHRSENSSSVPCDGNKIHPEKSPEHYRLEYDIYLMFLEEGDTSEDTFFKGLQKMAYPAVIKTNGKKVRFFYL